MSFTSSLTSTIYDQINNSTEKWDIDEKIDQLENCLVNLKTKREMLNWRAKK
jgi:hypothetical protein